MTATTAVDDGLLRQVHNLRVTPYDIPPGCVAGYYPECNPLLPLAHHAEESKVPAAKSIPVRLKLADIGDVSHGAAPETTREPVPA